MPEPGRRLRRGGRRRSTSSQTALSEHCYDAGVKKPVAVPKTRKVPSGEVSEASKLQVTSPCGFALAVVSVSVWVGPPGGVNSKVVKDFGDKDRRAAHDMAGREGPATDDDELDLLVVTGCRERKGVLGVDRVGRGPVDKGRHHQDP